MEKKLSLSKKAAFLIMSTSLVSASSAMEGPGVRRLINHNGGENIMQVNTAPFIQIVYNTAPNISNAQVNQYFEDVKTFITNYSGNDVRVIDGYRLPNGLSRSKRVNALRALENNLRMANDRDWAPISENENCAYLNNNIRCGTKDLLARVWSIILRTTGTDKVNLETALFNNLNEVIENDGHRTCHVGKSARLLRTLQGHIPGINIDAELAAPDDWCTQYETDLYRAMPDEDPLKELVGLEIPEDFSFQDLINRLAAERGDVLIKINGYYGSNSPQALTAIQNMEERFRRIALSYTDNATADQLLAFNGKTGALEDYDFSISNLGEQQERARNRRPERQEERRRQEAERQQQLNREEAQRQRQEAERQTQERERQAREEAQKEAHIHTITESIFLWVQDGNAFIDTPAYRELMRLWELHQNNFRDTELPGAIDQLRRNALGHVRGSTNREYRPQQQNTQTAENRRHQQRDIPSGFDHQFYLGNAPLLTQSVQGQTQEQRYRAAEEHYINHGRAEGRPYNRPIQIVVPTDFDHEFYLGNAPRLTQSVQGQTQQQRYRAAEEHYINHGRAEGRPYRR